jgi:hypothetical protein
MSTERQIAANRINATRSTGPRSPEGKAAVRFNALRYGLRAESLVLPRENSDEFHELCQSVIDEWQPQNTTEEMLVAEIAQSYWRLLRADFIERGHYELCESSYENEFRGRREAIVPLTRERLARHAYSENILDRLSAYRARLFRSLSKAVNDLIRLRRLQPIAPQPPAQSDTPPLLKPEPPAEPPAPEAAAEHMPAAALAAILEPHANLTSTPLPR